MSGLSKVNPAVSDFRDLAFKITLCFYVFIEWCPPHKFARLPCRYFRTPKFTSFQWVHSIVSTCILEFIKIQRIWNTRTSDIWTDGKTWPSLRELSRAQKSQWPPAVQRKCIMRWLSCFVMGSIFGKNRLDHTQVLLLSYIQAVCNHDWLSF